METDPKRWKVVVPALFVFFYIQRGSRHYRIIKKGKTSTIYRAQRVFDFLMSYPHAKVLLLECCIMVYETFSVIGCKVD